jgi:hypothetical protein
MPLVGNIPLAGSTVSQAANIISVALRQAGIVENARPLVAVKQYGASVYVGGEVRQPGAVRLASGMDAMQAVIVAGGLLDTAKSKRVVIIRRGADGRPVLTQVNLHDFARGRGGGIAALRSQDVVFVPRSSIAEANVWVDQHINRLLPFGRSLNYNLARTPSAPWPRDPGRRGAPNARAPSILTGWQGVASTAPALRWTRVAPLVALLPLFGQTFHYMKALPPLWALSKAFPCWHCPWRWSCSPVRAPPVRARCW